MIKKIEIYNYKGIENFNNVKNAHLPGVLQN